MICSGPEHRVPTEVREDLEHERVAGHRRWAQRETCASTLLLKIRWLRVITELMVLYLSTPKHHLPVPDELPPGPVIRW